MRYLALAIVALLTACSVEPRLATAAQPWTRLVPFKHIEADPDNMYPIGEDNGPWMIMATTFSGDGGKDEARALVHELRTRYKLRAYTYQKKFDFSKAVPGLGMDKYGTPETMRYRRGDEIVETAVLVGNYSAVDDPEAQKVLKKLKYAQPDTLKLDEKKSTGQTLAALRMVQRTLLPDGNERKKKGPMGHAFVVTNPMLPTEYYAPKGIDKLVLSMNKGVKHSLLDCPDLYTVKVATFTGHVVLDQKLIKQIQEGAHIESGLADAADKAHRLTLALREKQWEAYEFHDRYSSIVTVGSFKAVGTPRADGKIEINPQIHKIMRTFGAENTAAAGNPGAQVGKPKTLLSIPFDVQPIPVQVPRRSISSDYAGGS